MEMYENEWHGGIYVGLLFLNFESFEILVNILLLFRTLHNFLSSLQRPYLRSENEKM